MKPLSSVISGLPNLEPQASSSIGQLRGGTGVATEDQARRRLVDQTPAETDRNLLAWLESSLNVVAKPRTRMFFPPTGGYRSVTEGFDVEGLTNDNRVAAREAVRSAMTQPTHEQVEEWVAGLNAVTQHRTEDNHTAGLALGLYTARLKQYPADVVRDTCMAFAVRRQSPNWFPSLSEIDEACEKATESRQALLRSLS